MLRSYTLPLTSIVLVAGLLFPPMAAYTAVYATLAGLLIGLVLLSPHYWEVFGEASFRLIWLSILALLISLPFVYEGTEDLLVFAALLPIFLAPAATMILREQPHFATPQVIGFLCLTGVIGGVAVALNDVLILHNVRAGGSNNAIHFSGLSLILGFLSLIGLFGSKSIWRFVYLIGPVLGVVVVLLSGSRGPALTAASLSCVCLPLLVIWLRREMGFWVILGVGVLATFVAMNWISTVDISRATNVFGDIAALFTKNQTLDGATQERLVLYEAALEAFKLSPIFGHGSGHISAATALHMPEAFAYLRQPDHLHSDIADFAVIGGVFGLGAYLCLIIAPFLAVRATADVETRRAVLLGGIILGVGYFSLGLTNAMFGILPQTTLYGLMIGVLVGIAQNSSPEV